MARDVTVINVDPFYTEFKIENGRLILRFHSSLKNDSTRKKVVNVKINIFHVSKIAKGLFALISSRREDLKYKLNTVDNIEIEIRNG